VRTRVRGFTLLEAIVALSVVATAITASFALLNFTLATTNRMQEAVQRGEAIESAAQLVDRMNPFETPDGELALADCVVRWSSQMRGQPRRNTVRAGETGPFEVALFDVKVTGVRQGADWFTFTAQQVGFRRVFADRGPFE
jgi:general secretion pathway protein I